MIVAYQYGENMLEITSAVSNDQAYRRMGKRPYLVDYTVPFLNNGSNPLFVYFLPFLTTMTNIVHHLTIKSVDGVLGIRTQDRRMVGAAMTAP